MLFFAIYSIINLASRAVQRTAERKIMNMDDLLRRQLQIHACKIRMGIIEGVYMPEKKCIFGLEWHPELLPDNPGYKLFDYFVDNCR